MIIQPIPCDNHNYFKLQLHNSSTMKFFSAVALLYVSAASAFVAPSSTKQSTTLQMTSVGEGIKKAAASLVAAAFLASNLAAVQPAIAVDDYNMDIFGSSQVVAGRSGGRAGGRSMAPRARAPAPSSSRTVIQRTTYVQPSPVIVAPPIYGGYGYGYNPLPGLGKCKIIWRCRKSLEFSAR